MAHKTLIGGTAYEISGGKTLVGGTAYKIDKGKTLVGGTAYTVSFSGPVTVTLKGTFSSTYGYVKINNGTFASTFGPLSYEEPPSIYIYVRNPNGGSGSYVKLNGTTVQDGSGGYTFTPDPNTTVVITMGKSSGAYYATIKMS